MSSLDARLARVEKATEDCYRAMCLLLLRQATSEEGQCILRLKDAFDDGHFSPADDQELITILRALAERARDRGLIDWEETAS